MEIRYRTLSLAVRYNTVLFPFETLEFLQALAQLGYAFPEPQQPPLGSRVEVGGVLGRKGGASVRIDPDKMVLGVGAVDPESLVAEFDAVETLVESRFGITGTSIAMFYELLAGVVVTTGKSPLEAWDRIRAQVDLLNPLGKILGTTLAPFGIKVAPSAQQPNQADWVEMRIEPDVQTNCRSHSVEIVCRRTNREDVLRFTKSLGSTIQSTIEAVER